MGSPYQLILLNLIHIQGFLLGSTRVLGLLRRGSTWRPAMLSWRFEQERQLRILLVLFKRVGGSYSLLHRTLLRLAEFVGWVAGIGLAMLPMSVLRVLLKQLDDTLTTGLERAGHQIAIADWTAWTIDASINPPKTLLELAGARREWLSKSEGVVQFL